MGATRRHSDDKQSKRVHPFLMDVDRESTVSIPPDNEQEVAQGELVVPETLALLETPSGMAARRPGQDDRLGLRASLGTLTFIGLNVTVLFILANLLVASELSLDLFSLHVLAASACTALLVGAMYDFSTNNFDVTL
jgi:hypothetical protein